MALQNPSQKEGEINEAIVALDIKREQLEMETEKLRKQIMDIDAKIWLLLRKLDRQRIHPEVFRKWSKREQKVGQITQ